MIKFKRGIIISSKYYFQENINQELIVVDSEGTEYEINWITENEEDFFGEGDKVSFLFDEDNDLMLRMRLNPFYEEKKYESKRIKRKN